MLRFLIASVATILVLIVTVIIAIAIFILPDLPDVSAIKQTSLQVPLRIYSYDGFLIGEYGEKKRIPVNLEDVPPQLISAVVATEDQRFREHRGVDWIGVARAALANVSSDELQGASTITMQVARNFFLTPERTFRRKLKELFLAIDIEKKLTKDEILELYLNKVFFGNQAYGVAAASQVYYGLPLEQLSLAQMAMLAGLPQRPSVINPVTKPALAVKRRNHVLKRLYDQGYIDEQELKAALKEKDHGSLHRTTPEIDAGYVAEMVRRKMLKDYGKATYTDNYTVTTTIIGQLQQNAVLATQNALEAHDKRQGFRPITKIHAFPAETATETQLNDLLKNIKSVNALFPAMVVEITPNKLQAYVRNIGIVTIDRHTDDWTSYRIGDAKHILTSYTKILRPGNVIWVKENTLGEWVLTQIPKAQAAFVAMDARSGKLLALTGGYSSDLSTFNRAIQSKRQPGSGFKPFIFSAAFAAGLSPSSFIEDAPFFRGNFLEESSWRPENYSKTYHGLVTLREALTYSYNLASIRLVDQIGISFVRQYITKFGIKKEDMAEDLTLALGNASLSPWEMNQAYAIFANGGYRVEPYFIDTIQKYGETVFSKTAQKKELPLKTPSIPEKTTTSENAPQSGKQFIDAIKNNVPEPDVDPRNIWLVNSLMHDVIQYGTGKKAKYRLNRQDLYGKTGTTNEARDAWFFGFNQNIVATAWMGYDDFSSLGPKETGSSSALPMWIEFMQKALQGETEQRLLQPQGIVAVRINSETGMPTTATDPLAVFEYFLEENAPQKKSKKIEQSEENTVPLEQIF